MNMTARLREEGAVLDTKATALEEDLTSAFIQLQVVRMQQQTLLQSCGNQDTPQDPHHIPTHATIHTIPSEILIHIFRYITTIRGTDSSRGPLQEAHDAFRCAMVISHICRSWRDISLRTSSMWTCILFTKNLRGVRTCLSRSKHQPLHIARPAPTKLYPALPEKEVAMKSYLESTSTRWASVGWISSDIVIRHVLVELNRVPSFPFLTTLELVADEQRLLGPRLIPFVSDFLDPCGGNSFPNLEHMKLTQVPPSDLPPTVTPALRTLYLHFPHKQPGSTYLLRLSNLCATLYRAPKLEELVVDDCMILVDIRLTPFDQADQRVPPVVQGARQTHRTISPLIMQSLTRFQWDFAPPRDLWRLFYFVRMPHLRQLDLLLDRAEDRWLHPHSGLISESGSLQPIVEILSHPVVRFEVLEDLRVECLDTDGLSAAFRKVDFPALKSLSLRLVESGPDFMSHGPSKYSRLANAGATSDPPFQLPRAETLFRDPRMPTLVSLELINFHLDGPHTKTALQYMPALECLTLEACTNVNEVVHSVGGGASVGEQWLCPALEHLTLKKCHDVDYGALSQVVSQRRHAYFVGIDSQRVFVPLRKKPIKQASPAQSPQSHQPLANFPTPRHSWSSHEKRRPRPLKSVSVLYCDRVTDEDMASLARDFKDVVFIS